MASSLIPRESLKSAAGCTPKSEAGFEKAILMVRFMNEIARVALAEARDTVIDVIQHQRAFRFENRKPVDVAGEIVLDVGNAFLAVSVARMYLAAASGTRWQEDWEHVVELLLYVDAFAEPALPAAPPGETLH